jgi:uncharacterized protein (DUF2336 family)
MAEFMQTVDASHSPAPDADVPERMTARPAVLRALTDLFCLRNDPLEEEVQRFRELALRIIPDAGPSTRLYMAAKLARHPMAPRDVLERLAENDPACAVLLLEHAKNYPVDAQIEAALNADRKTAVALAARSGLDASVGDALVARNDPVVTRALAQNPTAKLTAAAVEEVKDDSRPDRIYADALRAKAPAPARPPEGFLAADPAERAKIVASARRAALGHAKTPVRRNEHLIDELLGCAIERKWDGFASALARQTGLRGETVRRLVRDDAGEPLALLLALVGATRSEAVRIFLCCESSIAHSYTRVRELAAMTDDTPATAAGALIFGMCGSRPRISTYGDTPERAAERQAESVRANEAHVARPAATTARPSRAPVLLRRKIT